MTAGGAQYRAAASAVPVVAGARFPRITTRGAYDLSTGEPVAGWEGGDVRRKRGAGRGGGTAPPAGKARPPYRLYPKSYFDGLAGSPELVVMVHGMRNTTSDAARKFAIAKDRLRELGYGHPVVGYSYDSNTAGASATSPARRARAAEAAVRIAEQNGPRLAAFVREIRVPSPSMRVRLIGHSLGSHVIFSALADLAGKGGGGGGRKGGAARGPHVESVHLFGASVPASAPSAGSPYAAALSAAVRSSITSHYAPTDEVLLEAAGDAGAGGGGEEAGGRARPDDPLGLYGAHGQTVPKYREVEVKPENHRFASYAAVLDAFP